MGVNNQVLCTTSSVIIQVLKNWGCYEPFVESKIGSTGVILLVDSYWTIKVENYSDSFIIQFIDKNKDKSVNKLISK